MSPSSEARMQDHKEESMRRRRDTGSLPNFVGNGNSRTAHKRRERS